jgi:hypothetical protein
VPVEEEEEEEKEEEEDKKKKKKKKKKRKKIIVISTSDSVFMNLYTLQTISLSTLLFTRFFPPCCDIFKL